MQTKLLIDSLQLDAYARVNAGQSVVDVAGHSSVDVAGQSGVYNLHAGRRRRTVQRRRAHARCIQHP